MNPEDGAREKKNKDGRKDRERRTVK